MEAAKIEHNLLCRVWRIQFEMGTTTATGQPFLPCATTSANPSLERANRSNIAVAITAALHSKMPSAISQVGGPKPRMQRDTSAIELPSQTERS